MASLRDSEVRALLEPANCAVISTLNADGSIHDAVAWISLEDGELAVNSAVGRHWPNNLDRDPRITVLVYDGKNPYEYVEIRGTVKSTRDEPTTTSTGWPRSTPGRTSIPTASPERSGSST